MNQENNAIPLVVLQLGLVREMKVLRLMVAVKVELTVCASGTGLSASWHS